MATRQQHKLFVEDRKGRREFVLDEKLYALGDGSDCEIQLFSPVVQSHHVMLVQVSNDDGTVGYRVVEGNTGGNDVYINANKLATECTLQHLDEITIGSEVSMIYHQERHGPSTHAASTSSPRTPSAGSDASPIAIVQPSKRKDILYYNQALEYANEEQWHEVKMLLDQAIALRSDEAEYYSLLGVAYLGLRDNHAALVQFRLAYSLDKDDPLLQPHMQFLLFGEFGLSDYRTSTGDGNVGYGTSPVSRSPFPE
ncbi:MAG: FHA domain-containing protein [Leptolyngbya sp. BL-A-14]